MALARRERVKWSHTSLRFKKDFAIQSQRYARLDGDSEFAPAQLIVSGSAVDVLHRILAAWVWWNPWFADAAAPDALLGRALLDDLIAFVVSAQFTRAFRVN